MSIFSKIMGFLEEPQETAPKLSQEEFTLQQTSRYYLDKIDNIRGEDIHIPKNDPDLLAYGITFKDLFTWGKLCAPVRHSSWKWGLRRFNKVSYENFTKVGDHYYLNGEYIGGCAYSLLKTFLDNPKRFKVTTIGELINWRYSSSRIDRDYTPSTILDTKTQIEFSDDMLLAFGMPSKVTPNDVKLVSDYIRRYYNIRADRLDELKQSRKEKALLKQYCTCGD